MGDVTVQSKNVGLTLYRLKSLSFHGNRPSHSWDTAFFKFDLENPGSRSNDNAMHNYMSRQFHITSDGINPSGGFRDTVPQIWPNFCLIWQVFGPWATPIWSKWANSYDVAQLQVYTSPWNFKRGEIHPAVSDICVPQCLEPICVKFDKLLWPMGKPT